ncbi:MAG: tetratricopeptide repeat protein [Bacteroidales bacterium]|jgi:tetratricopeptide (TPR) repeat protein|nr:tetratricopeptide repeat protein [Bacteroidales bacterium]
MKTGLIYVVLLLQTISVINSYAQEDTETLESALDTADTKTKLELYLKNMNEQLSVSSDTSLLYYDEALIIAKAEQDSDAIAEIYANAIIFYSGRDKKQRAIDELNKYIAISKLVGDVPNIYKGMRFLGALKGQQSKFNEALNIYREAMNYATDSVDIASLNINIGLIFFNLEDKDNALNYFKSSEEMCPHYEYDIRAIAINNLASIYLEIDSLDLAIHYYQEAISIDKRINNKDGVARSYHNLGLLNKKIGEYSKAVTHYKEALRLRRSLDNKRGIGSTLSALGSLHYGIEDYSKAGKYYRESLQFVEEAGSLDEKAGLYSNIAELYEKEHNYQRAYFYLKRKVVMQDSINKLNSIVVAKDNKHKYEIDLLESRIAQVEEERDGVSIELSDLEKKYRNMIVVLVSALILSVVAMFVVKFIRNRK